MGRAIDFVPYFVVALREMGRTGLGRGRAPWRLDRVHDGARGDGGLVYDGAFEDERLLCPPLIQRGPNGGDLPDDGWGQVTLRFETPTRLRFDGHLTDKLEFHILIRNLLRRLSALAVCHCGFSPALDYRGLVLKAERVKTREVLLKWEDWERYSARQNARMALGGFTGTVTFEGDLKPFAALLRLGEVVHVGKGSSFGLGKYAIAAQEGAP